MTVEEFREAMTAASKRNELCYLLHNGREVIAVGLDSARSVAILFRGGEAPLSELRTGFE